MAGQRQGGRSRKGFLSAAWVTDVGRWRKENQDRCLVDASEGVFIVSDGMGGETAGARAAQLVVDTLPRLVDEALPAPHEVGEEDVNSALRDCIVQLNRIVRQESAGMGGTGKMGATVVMALAAAERLHIANLGDSRAYLFHRDELALLSMDHSVTATLVRRGVLTPAQARNHPMQGRLARYVGMAGEPRPAVGAVKWRPGSRLLLCTDGLTGAIREDQIERIVACRWDILQACHDLGDAANEAGGEDNVTALLVENLA